MQGPCRQPLPRTKTFGRELPPQPLFNLHVHRPSAMRTSKVSKDTAKLFDRASGSVSPPRRTTRASLARFSYATPSATDENASQTPDIEDGPVTPARKRRKVTKASPVVKSEFVEEALSTLSSPPSAKPSRRARKPVRKTTDPSTGESSISPPSDWDEMYRVVKEMRSPGGAAHGAAVDTMGCERLADREASPRDQRFHTLIALMLSSQTKDTVNAVVMKKLQTELPSWKAGEPKGLNLENVLAVEPQLLNQMIWAVGFHNNKTKFVAPLFVKGYG